jgi:hypothetical protein
MIRRFSEWNRLTTFEERFEYLVLRGRVGEDTFGFDRYLNQEFYRSSEWRHIRDVVIVRDQGCDLGLPGYEIHDRVYIHHVNPMTPEDLIHGRDGILDPEFLITTTHRTHNAIHYGGALPRATQVVERRPGDTKLW